MLENIPLEMDDFCSILTKTVYLSTHVRRWGNLTPVYFGQLARFQSKHRYAFIGTEDWFMHPLLPPGSFIQIDEVEAEVSIRKG